MIQRYTENTAGPSNIDEYEDGEYCLHDDHLSALSERDAEIAKLREEVAGLREHLAIISRIMPTETGKTACRHGVPTDRWCNICSG